MKYLLTVYVPEESGGYKNIVMECSGEYPTREEISRATHYTKKERVNGEDHIFDYNYVVISMHRIL